MLGLEEKSPLEMLQQFAVYFDANLEESLGAATLILNNKHGEGSISLYELFPGLTAWVYNITFNSELVIDLKFSSDRPYYFGYHVSGFQMQKFAHETEYHKIRQGQNFILISEPGTSSEFKMSSGVKFESCYLILTPSLLKGSSHNTRKRLEQNLKEIFSQISGERPYRYFGDIDAHTGTFAEIIVKNTRIDLVGRLLTEGAITNLLAAQIEAHDLDHQTDNFQPKLTKSELSKITELGDYIRDNIDDKLTISVLSKYLGFSPRKLQAGVRFLYSYSVNEYVGNVRMEVAKELIYKTNKSVSEICYMVGYSSRSHFSNLFYKRFGILPSKYKDSFYKNTLMYEVSYRSIASEKLNESDVQQILDASRINNKKNNITGSLIYYKNVFFQLIEGPKKEVLPLYDKIKEDERHTDVITMWSGSKPYRTFKKWDMSILSDDGMLSIQHQDRVKKLNLEHLLGEIDENAIVSRNLWRKVRTIINVSGKVSKSEL
ncbi:BLUF domain-containing protein [uncultured Aquimarina sp.]|uniref:BLUF domain-containing protein n=1 Tax=uncultured Aquimarina sp. TaxID=575652 RepID=UPI00261C0C12|nr:BLUF domain-containing protein [uncultured Aquimarina sp.]